MTTFDVDAFRFALGLCIRLHGGTWRVGMVGVTGGERYYWLTGVSHRIAGTVSMMPASVVEGGALEVSRDRAPGDVEQAEPTKGT